MSLLFVYLRFCFSFTAKRQFDFPTECETGFTEKLNWDSLIEYSLNVIYVLEFYGIC